ncbi:MAG: UvrY/SirA/GacA family response regulator transcription factor [Candidatus Comchoanobacterales bacterium]
MISVLVIDDLCLIRTGIKKLLSDVSGIKVVGEGDSGEEAVKLSRELQPDVVLMDIKMPGIGGLEATRKIMRVCPDTKVLGVTVCEDDLFVSRLLKCGAYGFLTKGASLQEMVRAIKTVFSGQRYLSPEIANQLALKHVNDDGQAPFEMLSERELQVCLMIIHGHKVQDVAEKLHLSPKTVNSYRYRIFDKLSIKNDVELTHMAIKHGLLEDVWQGV